MFIEMELNEIIETSESINVYNNGQTNSYAQNCDAYKKIIDGWTLMTEGVHEMPAFGVSLNKQTVKEMNSGLWVEFVFDKQYEHTGMPFEKLLINVEKQWQGFNIIRYNTEDGYSGRCFYYDLVGTNMSEFYDILSNL